MTYEEVLEILGRPGEELSRSDIGDMTTTVRHQWKAADGFGNMNATFQRTSGDVLLGLVSKAQFGLK
jgi:hypothetical protein